MIRLGAVVQVADHIDCESFLNYIDQLQSRQFVKFFVNKSYLQVNKIISDLFNVPLSTD